MRGNTVRKQVFVYAGAALVLAVAAIVWFVLTQWGGDALFADHERVNVLLIGRDASNEAVLISLCSVSETDAVLFSFPTNLRLRDSSGDFQAAGTLCEREDLSLATSAMADLIGTDIPFYLAFDFAELGAWVASAGALEVALDHPAIYLNDRVEPAIQVEIREGIHSLAAGDAVVFATGESVTGDVGIIERQQAFLIGLLAVASDEALARSTRSNLRNAHDGLDTNLSSIQLVRAVEALQAIPSAEIRAGQLAGEIAEIDGVTYTQPNAVDTERLVAALLKGLDLLTPGDVKVAVFNGNGVRLMARRTADYLIARGFQVTGIRNAESFDYETSFVIVLSDEAKAWMLRDALPSGAQIVFPGTFESRYEALADYIPAGTDLVFIAGAGLEIE